MSARAAGRMLQAWALCGLAGAAAGAQEKPLRRSFQAGAVETYRVEVSVRTEIRGVQAEMIGSKAYVKPFVQAGEGIRRWTAVRRIGSVDEAGIAEMEESLERPAGDCPSGVPGEEDSAVLREAVKKFCGSWNSARVIHYRERADGFIQDFPPGESPELEPMGCPVIQLWSRHALRPSAILPAEPLRIGGRRERKLQGEMPGLGRGQGSEMTEWLPAARGAALALHVVQEFAGDEREAGAEKDKRVERSTFFAESLANISTLDGSLGDATRSASCETLRKLDAVEGLPEPPRFSSKLSVTVTIHRIP